MGAEFIECITKKDLELLKAFINEKNPDLNAEDGGATIPLNMAVHVGNIDVFSYLVEQGCDVNNCDSKGETPLIFACVKGNVDISKILIDKGCDVNKQTKSGLSAFLVACKCGNMALMSLLVEHGADIHVTSNENKNAYYFATTIDSLTFLLNNNVSISVLDKDGYSPLLLSVKNGNYPKFKFMLEHIKDYNPDEATKDGETAILFCADSQFYQQELMVSDLLKLGADANKKDNYDMSPMHKCASNNHVKVATVLLEHGVDLDVTEPCFGNTPLQIACGNGHLDMIKLLLQKGANINFVNTRGLTALDCAKKACVVNQEVISFLVSNGAVSASKATDKDLSDITMKSMEVPKSETTGAAKKKSGCILM